MLWRLLHGNMYAFQSKHNIFPPPGKSTLRKMRSELNGTAKMFISNSAIFLLKCTRASFPCKNRHLWKRPTVKIQIVYVMFKTRTARISSSLKIRGRSPIIFRLDKTRAVSVLNSFKNDPLLVVFAFSFNSEAHRWRRIHVCLSL